jgi:endo-1,4-beta-xylanase
MFLLRRLPSAFHFIQVPGQGCQTCASFALAAAVVVLVLLTPRPVRAQGTPIIQDDFEDGTLQGWIPRGGSVVLTNTTEAARSGTHSLKTTGRTAGFNGPSLNVFGTLAKGSTYQVTAWVRLVAGQPADTLKITVQRTLTDGTNAFDQVPASSTGGVTDAAWVSLQGQYTLSTDVTALLLYIEAAGATTQYYLDDFSIVLLASSSCGSQQDTSGIHTNFEDGSAEGWKPRIGEEVVTVTTADKHSGNFSLLTSGRQHTFSGPSIDAAGKLCNGSQYRVSFWAKLAPGEPDAQLRFSEQRTLAGATNFDTLVGNTTVTASQWVSLTALINFAFSYDSLTLYVESASGTPSFYIDDFDLTVIPPIQIEQNIPSVFETLADFFPIGTAVYPGAISGPHSQLLAKHFNGITSENDMKWDATEPTEGMFRFTNADAQVSFAKAHNMRIRGHTLVWHNQIPSWVFLDASGNPMTPTPENKALLLQRLTNHIRGVVSHFGSDIYAWDVMNEVIDPAEPDGFRRSPWFNITGTDYIDTAFQITHELAPNAELFINDFNTTQEPKRTFLFNLVKDLQNRGIPVTGVGHQMHSNIQFPLPQSVTDTINLFSTLGVDQQVTELDISIYTNSSEAFTDYASIPNDRLVQQGYLYRDFFQVFRQMKDKISEVTFWGEADDHTFLTTPTRVDAPLLFDQGLQHKLAYLGVVDPLQLPGANITTTITSDSSTVLSGHDVTYAITVTNGGPNDAATVSLVDTLPAATVYKSIVAPAGWTCTTPAAGSAGQVNCTAATLANSASVQFMLTITVVCGTPNATVLTNSVAVTSTTCNPNPNPTNAASVSVNASNPPPVISGFSANRTFLWPPSHRFARETLTYTVTATCDVGLVPVITVSSNQPSDGRPNHPDVDWVIVDPTHVLLRAEDEPQHRDGGASGNTGHRIYTITATVTDSAGSSTTSSVRVPVARPDR